MKLGQQVCFSRHWVKNPMGIDPAEHTDSERCEYSKLISVDCGPMIGIVVGKRNLGTITTLEFRRHYKRIDEPEETYWTATKTKLESFYLVACDLKGFYKVKEADLWVVE
jgi:hypothetical protein